MAICGGGGGGSRTAMIDDSAREAAQQAANKKRDDEAAARAAFDRTIAEITGGAGVARGIEYFKRQGLDPEPYKSDIERLVATTARDIPDLDKNPYAYFNDSLYQGGIDSLQSGKRNTYNRQVQSTFAPGYENTVMPDSELNSIIDSILGGQKNQAQTALDYQRKRGTLTDTGYSAAEAKFNDQGTAARSTLDSLGRSALDKSRASITDIVGKAGNAANSWSLGMPEFDINKYTGMVNDRAATAKSSLEGDIRSALGNTQLFDIPTIVASGGTAQGPQNLTTENGPFVDPKKKTTSRGLGTTGVF